MQLRGAICIHTAEKSHYAAGQLRSKWRKVPQWACKTWRRPSCKEVSLSPKSGDRSMTRMWGKSCATCTLATLSAPLNLPMHDCLKLKHDNQNSEDGAVLSAHPRCHRTDQSASCSSPVKRSQCSSWNVFTDLHVTIPTRKYSQPVKVHWLPKPTLQLPLGSSESNLLKK